MRTATRSDFQDLYEETARRFAERLHARFPQSVHSIVLYGSVARGAAGRDSDIDIIVLGSNGTPSRDDLVEISEQLDFENEYRTFVIATGLSETRLQELVHGRFPIAEHVLGEGIVLYDDGTFEGIRGSSVKAGH